ncbi:biotin transporter BioY [Pyramidobacter sp.]|uniref:biotin transporter BioY n=1 Tax=Pyramidobacter sp. TaxID=1943581 RepID=UPI0025E84A43|nr:biotin transporter BioY [Pyramidobacter sp.]MCI7402966.1 biotin transporter BioY [Pyramidobacter sp.]MDY3211635.1 biotin transporter BioY [Pyramidobacter sp.]
MEKNHVRNMAAVAAMTALMCVLGPLSVPVGPIPFSFQVFVVYLSVYALGARRGTLAVVLYLLIGFVGLPVFSGFAGGAGKLLGPTGGFLVGFIPLAAISGWFIDHSERVAAQFAGMLLGLAVLYLFGAAWLAKVANLGFDRCMAAAVYPFIPVDALKIVLAILLGRGLRRRLRAAGTEEKSEER